MSVKWIGVGTAMAGCIALGFMLAFTLGIRAQSLALLEQGIRMLAARVVSRGEPIDSALEALKDEYAVFSDVLASHETPYEAWLKALTGMKGLNSNDRELVARMMADSASAGMKDQKGIYEAGLAQLELRAKLAAEQAAGDARLYRSLGLLAAALVLVLAA